MTDEELKKCFSEIDADVLDNMLTDLDVNYSSQLIGSLSRAYPQLDIEAIVRETLVGTAVSMALSGGVLLDAQGNPVGGVGSFLYKCVRNRIYDELRSRKRRGEVSVPQADPENPFPDGGGIAPDSEAIHPLEMQEKRTRQGITLSDAIREFVTFCEEQEDDVWRKAKLVLEADMAELPKSTVAKILEEPNRNQLAAWKKRAKDRLRRILSRYDSHQTVLRTFWRQEARRKAHKGVRPTLKPKGSSAENPTASAAARADAEKMPPVDTFACVLAFILRETNAWCPSDERLTQYRESEGFTKDVRFHIHQRRCSHCAKRLASARSSE